MRSARVYSLHGLRVRSPFMVGETAGDPGSCDVDVVLGPSGPVTDARPPGKVLLAMCLEGRRLQTAAYEAGCHVLRVHGLCDFVVEEQLQSVECRPDPAAKPEQIALRRGLGRNRRRSSPGRCRPLAK